MNFYPNGVKIDVDGVQMVAYLNAAQIETDSGTQGSGAGPV
jgi:hypothetical protein